MNEPSRALEDRVVAHLAARGLLQPSRRRGPVLRVAAAAAAGLLLGWFLFSPPPSPAPDYVLLLIGGVPASPEESRQRVAEYRQWATDAAPRVAGGEKLRAGGVVLRRDLGRVLKEASEDFLGGYFLLRVDSLEAAAELAATCPHLEHGGRIEVRGIE